MTATLVPEPRMPHESSADIHSEGSCLTLSRSKQLGRFLRPSASLCSMETNRERGCRLFECVSCDFNGHPILSKCVHCTFDILRVKFVSDQQAIFHGMKLPYDISYYLVIRLVLLQVRNFRSLGPHLEKSIKMFTYADQISHGVSTTPVLHVFTCHVIKKKN